MGAHARVSAQPGKDPAHCILKRRKISHDNIPDGFKVHFKIVVYQNVAHSSYRRPIDLRMPLLVRLVDPLGRLAENLEVPDDGVLECTRGKYSDSARRGILRDSTDSSDDM